MVYGGSLGMRLKDLTVIVTGGGTGIGRGISQRLVREGANLVIGGIDVVKSDCNQYFSKNIGGYTAAKTLAKSLTEKGFCAVALEADVTKEEQVEKMINETVKMFGGIDILVNCAGVISFRLIENLTLQDWNHVIEVNLKGTYITNKAVVAQMRKQDKGKIINFSSESGKKGEIGLSHYCASKWGVIGFTKALAIELAKERITVNAICPGVVDTQMWKEIKQKLAKKGETEKESFNRIVQKNYPQGVLQTAEDMAEAVVFLSISDHITGEALSIDGGSTI